MYVSVKHLLVIAAVYGGYRIGKIIWQEHELRLRTVEEAVRELKVK